MNFYIHIGAVMDGSRYSNDVMNQWLHLGSFVGRLRALDMALFGFSDLPLVQRLANGEIDLN
jgi:hypothetical protein